MVAKGDSLLAWAKSMTRYRISHSVVAEQIDGEAVILNLQTSTYYKLDGVGARVWSLLKERPTSGELVRILSAEYAVPSATLQSDLAALLDELSANSLIEIEHETDEVGR